jgi:hypothetical protein
LPLLNETASVNIVVPGSTTFNPGDFITWNVFFSNRLVPTQITLPGGLGSSTIHLLQGSYVVHYAVSVFNTNSDVKMEIIDNGLFLISSFTAGPAGSSGTAHTSGNALILAPASGSNIQLRVDPSGDPIGPFANITMVIETVGTGPLTP